MSDNDSTAATVDDAAVPRRRRFLTGLGAGGLAVAATLMGRSTASATYNVGCCHLAFRPTKTLSQCLAANPHYVWACVDGPCTGCRCCEVGSSPYTASAYSCTTGHC